MELAVPGVVVFSDLGVRVSMSTNKCVPRRKKIDCGAVKEHMPTISGNTQSGQGLSSRFDVACAVDFLSSLLGSVCSGNYASYYP